VSLPPLTLLLAAPRGFCAGVDRAVQIVERALVKYGPPVYVRHEIVHNKYVVASLAAKGAVFVEEIDDVPADRPVIFSAHGVPKAVPTAATDKGLFYIDATCPLVSKVHKEAEILHEAGYHLLLIGHADHPEVIGTIGQLPEGSITLVQTLHDAEMVQPQLPVGYITQTTLSVNETKDIIALLERRFPGLRAPHKEDICYATTNRQMAVQTIAPRCALFLVIGAPNSSNSLRLVETAKTYGSTTSLLIQRAADIPWVLLKGGDTLGLTASASAPEELVLKVIAALSEHYTVTQQTISVGEEHVVFKLPKALAV
jgi:4-hydroxy-3-methylbut-2-enyl diphosphate reductase